MKKNDRNNLENLPHIEQCSKNVINQSLQNSDTLVVQPKHAAASSDNYNNADQLPSYASNPNFQNYNSYSYNNKYNKKKKRWGIVFWLSLIVMIACLIALGVIAAGYLEGCVMYDEIADDVFKDRESSNLTDMKIDWDALLAINPDTIGWVYMPGTQINYPVVHTTDNEKYLKTTFRGYTSYVSFGTIFMDCNNKHDMSDPNIVTYGHNMNDGSMYAQIAKMRNSEELNTHKTIYFLTPKGNYRLTAFVLDHVSADDKIIQVNFSTPEKKVEYINDKINRGVSKLDGPIPDASAMSKIFTFSTCDNLASDGRYVMFAYVSESTVDGVAGLG